MRIERLAQPVVDPVIDAEIRQLLDAAFSEHHEGDLQDFCNGDWWFVRNDENEIVAVTGLLRREVLVNGTLVMIAGIGGVATKESHRNQGFASALVSKAMAFARTELGLPFGLLQCHPELVGFYQSRGWSETPNRSFAFSSTETSTSPRNGLWRCASVRSRGQQVRST
jgi:GNAT superfamily N-acetyltransferase